MDHNHGPRAESYCFFTMLLFSRTLEDLYNVVELDCSISHAETMVHYLEGSLRDFQEVRAGLQHALRGKLVTEPT